MFVLFVRLVLLFWGQSLPAILDIISNEFCEREGGGGGSKGHAGQRIGRIVCVCRGWGGGELLVSVLLHNMPDML